MARLVSFGGDNGTHALSELDAVDLEALALGRQWGFFGLQETVYFRVRPCQWGACGGSVLSFGGEMYCLLCCRAPDWTNDARTEGVAVPSPRHNGRAL